MVSLLGLDTSVVVCLRTRDVFNYDAVFVLRLGQILIIHDLAGVKRDFCHSLHRGIHELHVIVLR